uniref:Putative RSC complex protein n=1 Tax=Moniliophthora roreri TaxID=221103 RepID=A0A0W0FB29_MONRR
MGKRELAALGAGAGVDEGSSRASRRKISHGGSSDVDMADSEPARDASSKEQAREQGLKLWQTVKDAMRECVGRSLTTHFMKQPPRRTYPDYYELIQHPIALEDIKKKLESRTYPDLEAVRADLELCFNNAKSYNVKDSEIYLDAKELLKLTNKAYNKLVPSEDGEHKHKPPSLSRLIKSRLQKLVAKTDDDGRVISDMFMELPSRKEWPIYYKEIKRPQCFENIFKRIKRKEYQSSSEFAVDVELVFSNALHFNQEHSQVWEDAVTLRDYFRTLMADMPPPFDLPQYSKPSNNKIKIKMPATHPPPIATAATTATISHSQVQPTASTSTTLRLPAAKPAAQPPVKTETTPKPSPASLPSLPNTNDINVNKTSTAAAPSTAPTATAAPKSTPKPVPAPTPAPKAATPAPASIAPAAPPTLTLAPTPVAPIQTYASLAQYVAKPSPTPAPEPVVKPPAEVPAILQSTSSSPAPPPAPQCRLKFVRIKTEPRGRLIYLDQRDGVSNWVMRFDKAESSLCVQEVAFVDDLDGDSSGGEEDADEEVDMEVDSGPKAVKKKRGRGRPPKNTRAAAAAAKATAPVKSSPPQKKRAVRGEIQVKINGTVVGGKEGESGRWTVELTTGSNILEVGEKGGTVWKVYAERIG